MKSGMVPQLKIKDEGLFMTLIYNGGGMAFGNGVNLGLPVRKSRPVFFRRMP